MSLMDDLRPNKKLGQHFLHDQRVLGRIVSAIGPASNNSRVIEIGPGPGALTNVLLEAGFCVDVIEKDPRWRQAMSDLGQAHDGRVRVVAEDALCADWDNILDPHSPVIGNLPYNVGTEIVADLVMRVASAQATPPVMVFMLQKEVVLRICATPGGKNQADWGRLGVLCDLLCERDDLFDVPPGAFNPPPKVMSSVVKLKPLPAPRFEVDLKTFDKVVRLAFGQRRKMLRASLRSLIDEAGIEKAGIEPTARPEIVTTEQFCRLANIIA